MALLATSLTELAVLWDGKTLSEPWRHWIGDASRVFDLVLSVLSVLRASCRRHGDLAVENLLLRHQLAVITRPTRRQRVRFRRLDTLLWVLIHRLRRDWRVHLLVMGPLTR